MISNSHSTPCHRAKTSWGTWVMEKTSSACAAGKQFLAEHAGILSSSTIVAAAWGTFTQMSPAYQAAGIGSSAVIGTVTLLHGAKECATDGRRLHGLSEIGIGLIGVMTAVYQANSLYHQMNPPMTSLVCRNSNGKPECFGSVPADQMEYCEKTEDQFLCFQHLSPGCMRDTALQLKQAGSDSTTYKVIQTLGGIVKWCELPELQWDLSFSKLQGKIDGIRTHQISAPFMRLTAPFDRQALAVRFCEGYGSCRSGSERVAVYYQQFSKNANDWTVTCNDLSSDCFQQSYDFTKGSTVLQNLYQKGEAYLSRCSSDCQRILST